MKPIPFILIGVTAMISISVMSGLRCKKQEPAVYDFHMVWSKDRINSDGCTVTYFWYDPTGKYPFTKDTCCLDSVIWTPDIANCLVQTNYDTTNNTLDITIICEDQDSVYVYPSK